MKNIRRIILLTLVTLLACSLFLGCTLLIPEEYTEGVKLERDYPEDEMPLMDDAIVYSSDADNDTITIKYGVEDDLDDVADFYKDFFDDNEIVLDDESDKSSRYTAQGSYKGFNFEIRVSNASGEYEEKVFETTVKIEIEFVTELPTDERLVGFWRQETFDDGSGEVDTLEYGTAYEFTADGKFDIYVYFEFFGEASWSLIDPETILVTSIAEESDEATVAFEDRDGDEYLILKDATGTLTFTRASSEEFTMYTEQARQDDEKLIDAITTNTWYYVAYVDAGGQTYATDIGQATYYTDGSFSDTMNGTTVYGGWYIVNSVIFSQYEDESIGESRWRLELSVETDATYLSFHDIETGDYFFYSNVPASVDASLLADTVWYSAVYVNPDGSVSELSDPESLALGSDGSFANEFSSGAVHTGTWEVIENLFFLYYDDTSIGTVSWAVEVSRDGSIGIMKLYDMREESAGGFWEYINLPIIDGIATFTADADIQSVIFDVEWNELYYQYADGTTEAMDSNSMFFYSDGTLVDHYDGADHDALWHIEDGYIYMTYPDDDNEEFFYPVHIVFDVFSRVLHLHLGDLEPGFEGASWVFTTYQP